MDAAGKLINGISGKHGAASGVPPGLGFDGAAAPVEPRPAPPEASGLTKTIAPVGYRLKQGADGAAVIERTALLPQQGTVDLSQAPAQGTYGSMPLDAIQGPGRWNVDMGLSRTIPVGGRQLQLRWEVFNVFNTVNLDNPVATLNSPDFGRITALAAGTAPRIMQLAMKYQF